MREVNIYVKTSSNLNLDPSHPPKKKVLSILTKDTLKIEIELFHSVLFHMKNRVFLKYFACGCSFSNEKVTESLTRKQLLNNTKLLLT